MSLVLMSKDAHLHGRSNVHAHPQERRYTDQMVNMDRQSDTLACVDIDTRTGGDTLCKKKTKELDYNEWQSGIKQDVPRADAVKSQKHGRGGETAS